MHAFQRSDMPFGNWQICERRLRRGQLALRYNNGHTIYDFKKRQIGPKLKRAIESALSGRSVISSVGLSAEETEYLDRLIRRSGIEASLAPSADPTPAEREAPLGGRLPVTEPIARLPSPDSATNSRLKNEFYILLGERSLNDNPEIVEQLRRVTEQMVDAGMITREIADEFLNESDVL